MASLGEKTAPLRVMRMLSSTVMVRLAAMADTPRPTVKAATRIPLQKPFPKPFFIIKTPLSCQICGGVSRPF